MRGQRGKHQDWSKPFKMVFSKAEFDDLQTSDDTVINIQTHEPAPIPKQEIITPLIQTVKRHTDIKPFAKISPNYIRLAPHLNLPKINDYQLTEVDHIFLQTHRQKFKLNGKIVLTSQFMKTIIMTLETKQGKDPNIPRVKTALTSYLEKQFKDLTKMTNYQNFTDLLYNYWRNRREELKFPLYRPLWRPNQDEFNHLLAFKLRQKQKRSLRRSSRTSEDDILEELTIELGTALRISERVETRQVLKQKQLQVQLSLFHQQLRSVFPHPDFLVEVNQQVRNRDKQKIKRFNQETERIRKQREVKNEEVKQPEPTIFDQKESVVNFLATVVAEAELCGLSYDKLFHYKSQVHVPLQPFIGQPIKDIPALQQQDEQCLNMSLRKARDYIIRKFQQQDDEDSSNIQINDQDYPMKLEGQNYEDMLDYKRHLVTRFYFGEDDEGDYQNLRKNISISFKRFQQTKEVQ